MKIVSLASITAYRSYTSSDKFQYLSHSLAYPNKLKVNYKNKSIELPSYNKIQNLIYYFNQSGAFVKGVIKSTTFRMRIKRVLFPTELLIIEGKGLKFLKIWSKNILLIIFNFLNFLLLTHLWTNFILQLINRKYEKFIINNNIDEVIIISTNQECELHLLALACEKLSIKYTVLIDNWDNLSSKTIMTNNPSQLLVWSQQICEHARLIQNYKGPCKPIGSIRFDELKKCVVEQNKLVKKVNKIYFCGATIPSSEISFLEFLLEHTKFQVVYRPHPLGFYISNNFAKNKIEKLQKLNHSKLKIIYATYGMSPEIEIRSLAHDLISHSVIICGPTSTFIESVSLGIPTFMLNWNTPDIIDGVKTKPTSWFVDGYLHINEVTKKYPLKFTNSTEFNSVSNVLCNDGYELIYKIFSDWFSDYNNKKFLIENNLSKFDFS